MQPALVPCGGKVQRSEFKPPDLVSERFLKGKQGVSSARQVLNDRSVFIQQVECFESVLWMSEDACSYRLTPDVTTVYEDKANYDNN